MADAVAATAGVGFPEESQCSADDVRRVGGEPTTLADELGGAPSNGAGTLVLRPARLGTLLDAISAFVESREQAEWIREEDAISRWRWRGSCSTRSSS